MKIDTNLKKKYNEELVGAENEPALPGKLQWRREMVEMFENLTDPQKIQERKLKENKKSFIRNKIRKFGL